jgi:5-methylcytosine-specific restriction endonuclease McrA|tara:strand:- start:659 stop:985 length:327 start_codon:yes stop_codon:yes gene_type:complete
MKYKTKPRYTTSKSELKYKTWRKNVFELNKGKHGLNKHYTCMKCKLKRKTTRILHAHHIKSWDKFPQDRYDRDNGVVMCKKCHYKFHKKYQFEALEKPELLNEYLKDK